MNTHIQRQPKHWLYIPLLFIACLVTSCAPKIYDFTVTPSKVCPGDHVTITWHTNMAATFSESTASGSSGGSGNLSYSHTEQVWGPMTYTLDVNNGWGGSVHETRRVEILSSGYDTIVTMQTTCLPPRGLAGHQQFPFLDPPFDRMVIQGVSLAAPVGRRITLGYSLGGQFFEGVPTAVIHNFDGKPLTGLWMMTSILIPPEQCPTAPVHPGGVGGTDPSGNLTFPTLKLRVHLVCPQNPPPHDNNNNGNSGTTPTVNTCGTDPSLPVFGVGIIDQAGCGDILAVHANSLADAIACVRSRITGTTITLADAGATLHRYGFSKTVAGSESSDTVYVWAFSEEDARRCANNTFNMAGNVTLTLVSTDDEP